MSEEKRQLLSNLDPNMPIDEMPDCEIKYKKILEEANKGNKWEDKKFLHDDSSLGPDCTNRGVSTWVRASEKEGCVLYDGLINHEDIV